MSKYIVSASKISGGLSLPPSKSQSLRAVLFAALAHGRSCIEDYLPSPDIFAMISAARILGASVEVSPKKLHIRGIAGKVHCAEDIIHAGNSGIVLRFCSAIGALGSMPVVITGDHSIKYRRPMKPIIGALEQLGVSVQTLRGDGGAPLIVRGPIQPGKAHLNGEDSQPVSALLIAGAFASGPIELCVENPGEKPWVDMTLHWLQRLEIGYAHTNYENYVMHGNARYDGFCYRVPGDLSTLAFPLAAAIITQSEVTLHNVTLSDPQGDKKIIDIFRRMGANIEVDETNQCLHVMKSGRLRGMSIDINDCIDALPILSVVACFAEGETLITNAAVAKHKESDRIHCVAKELQKMGAYISEREDGLWISSSKLKGAEVSSNQDHRIAMALSVAGMAASGTTCVADVECISKTYPAFLEDFRRLGAYLKEEP